tara:strand:+ start:22249 stop:22449 length:201 start_codon:yes stop_codon:yes gene_type:complete
MQTKTFIIESSGGGYSLFASKDGPVIATGTYIECTAVAEKKAGETIKWEIDYDPGTYELSQAIGTC